MKTFSVGYGRVRIWIGELPDATYLPIKTYTHKIAAGREPRSIIKQAAIEAYIPVGPRALYGLLGGQFEPDTTGQLTIEVNTSSPKERLFGDNLAPRGKIVRVGMPDEYSCAVLPGVALATDELGQLLSGKLLINCAAHEYSASCQLMYSHLTAILVKLFNSTNRDSSDDELKELLPRGGFGVTPKAMRGTGIDDSL